MCHGSRRPARGAGRGVTLVSIALLAVPGCSKHPTRPGGPSELHGTPVTPANAVEVAGPMLWSGLTGELICSGPFRAGGGLIAVHATTGATRTLDSLESFPEALAPGGSVVYYDAIESDVYDLSVLARRVALGRTPAPHTLESCSGFCFHFIEPAPDGDLLAVGELSDSLRIYRLSTGERTVVSEYSPLAFSPHSDLLLVKDLFDPLGQARILTLATGSTTPAALGVPDTISGFRLRWGPAGIEVLYVGGDNKSFFLRRVEAGATLRLWASPDTLDGYPIAWSSSGTRAALWSYRPSGTTAAPARRWELHLVDLVARTVRTVAYAEVAVESTPRPSPIARFRSAANIFPTPNPGGLAFSPDESEIAYTFFDGRIYRSRVADALATAR